jgi:hypothetical protein
MATFQILNLEFASPIFSGLGRQGQLDPFDGAKPRPLGRGRKRRSGSTLSVRLSPRPELGPKAHAEVKPQPLVLSAVEGSGWGVEGLTWKLKDIFVKSKDQALKRQGIAFSKPFLQSHRRCAAPSGDILPKRYRGRGSSEGFHRKRRRPVSLRPHRYLE